MTDERINPWEIGYKISNRYEIMDIKKGGMGVVYIAYDHEWDCNFAIKTFQDKYLWNNHAIQGFMEEAKTWTKFELHPNIIFAHFVEKIEGKPLIFLDYANRGDLSQFIGKLDVLRALDFAIQICNGMEYAYNSSEFGIIHRDIKPGNLLIQEDLRFRYGYCIKITDFGLVKVLKNDFEEDFFKISSGMGTYAYMPPEQFGKEDKLRFNFKGQITTRSDIYSLGVTFYQLLTGEFPFNNMPEIFIKTPINPRTLNQDIPEELDKIIMKCLEKNPEDRYNNFKELKSDLIKVYATLTDSNYDIFGKDQETNYIRLNNKGFSFIILEEYGEALKYLNKSLKLNPKYADAWNNKGRALECIGEIENARKCYDKALEINTSHVGAWNSKGVILSKINEYDSAITCFDKALEINLELAGTWINKGNILDLMGKRQEALDCYKEASEIDKRNPDIWYNQGMVLLLLGKFLDAENAFNKSLSINPRYHQSYNYIGTIRGRMDKYPEAITYFDKALEININSEEAWSNKGNALRLMGKHQDAFKCFNKALELDPENYGAHLNKGNTFLQLNKYSEALKCYNRALEIDQNSPEAWNNKGIVLRQLGKYIDAFKCFRKASKLNRRILRMK